MKLKNLLISAGATIAIAVLTGGAAISAVDPYALEVPGGLAFSDFKGYESWQVISISNREKVVAAILGNPEMIKAFQSGVPENGQPFPDGARMAKIHWVSKVQTRYPGLPTVAGALINVDFMVKDSTRFADSGGWGYAVFEYDAATKTFRPGDDKSMPPQAHDAKCGAACHTVAKARDFVFTEYSAR